MKHTKAPGLKWLIAFDKKGWEVEFKKLKKKKKLVISVLSLYVDKITCYKRLYRLAFASHACFHSLFPFSTVRSENPKCLLIQTLLQLGMPCYAIPVGKRKQ